MRLRRHRNFIATLLFTQGVPMIAHGDELGRTQQVNNNVYCQDNELSWVDWDLTEEQEHLLDFTQRMVHFRAAHPVLRRRRFFAGDPGHGGQSEIGEIAWLKPSAEPMEEEDWHESFARSIMIFYNGQAIPEPDARGERITDDSLIILLNADAEPVDFTIPNDTYARVRSEERRVGKERQRGGARARGRRQARN